MDDITAMLHAMHRKEPGAADRLMEAVYAELRRLSRIHLARENENGTLQPTALAHEAWLRLGGDEQADWENRAHFFSAASEAMRRILIDRARRRRRLRHGGGLTRVNLDDVAVPAAEASDEHLLAVDDALARLAAEEPKWAELVKLHIFLGLTLEEAARTLGISGRTARRWWAFARTWLYREIRS